MTKCGEPSAAVGHPQCWLSVHSTQRWECHEDQGEETDNGAEDEDVVALGLGLDDHSDGN